MKKRELNENYKLPQAGEVIDANLRCNFMVTILNRLWIFSTRIDAYELFEYKNISINIRF